MSPGQNDLNPKHGYPPCHTHVHPNGFGCFDERVVVKQQIKHAKKKKKTSEGNRREAPSRDPSTGLIDRPGNLFNWHLPKALIHDISR